MCIIIDANIASLVFKNPIDVDFTPILNWLQNGDGCIVTGGKLSKELFKICNAKRLILELSRAGKANIIPPDELLDEENKICHLEVCISNDIHIIALARLSGARTLCSHDRNLHSDFKNRILINNARGCIYQKSDHVHLLIHTSSCGHL